MNFVLIYGPPGVGKLTVAKELAAITGYKLFDNHVSIDAVRPVFDFADEPFWPLVLRLRADVFEAAARHGADLITTGAYVYPDDTEVVEGWFALVEENKGRVLPVHLTCRMPVLEERVQSESRLLTSKVHSLDFALADMAEKDYFTPIPGRASLRIDNSDLPPDAVARRIAEHYALAT